MTVAETLDACGDGSQKRQPCFDALRDSIAFFGSQEILKSLNKIAFNDPFMGYGWQSVDVPRLLLSSIEVHGRVNPTLASLILANLIKFYYEKSGLSSVRFELIGTSFSLLNDFGRQVKTEVARKDILSKIVPLAGSGNYRIANQAQRTIKALTSVWNIPTPEMPSQAIEKKRRPLWQYAVLGGVLIGLGYIAWRDLQER